MKTAVRGDREVKVFGWDFWPTVDMAVRPFGDSNEKKLGILTLYSFTVLLAVIVDVICCHRNVIFVRNSKIYNVKKTTVIILGDNRPHSL
jgi:hypothetical protein